MLPDYRFTDFFFIPQVQMLQPLTMSMSLGHPRISKVISSKLHHVKGASPPTISHDRRCSFLVYKHIVYKWLMGETTDQHVGFPSNGRQSSNDLRRVWAPPLEARPEMSQHHRGRSPWPKVSCPRSSCKKYLFRRLYFNLVQKGPWKLRTSDLSFG